MASELTAILTPHTLKAKKCIDSFNLKSRVFTTQNINFTFWFFMMNNFSSDAEQDLYTICRTYGMSPEDVDDLLTRKPIQIFEHLVSLGKESIKEKNTKEPVKIKILNNNNIPNFLKNN